MPFALRLLAVAALIASVACAGDDDSDEAETPTAAVPSFATPQPQPEPPQPLAAEQTSPTDGVIEVTAAGSLFVQNNLAVPAGETATIRVTNTDPTPHNLRIAGTDGLFETEDDAVTVPDGISQGSVGELAFSPVVDGYYTFRCDFHPTTMGGRIVAGEPADPPSTPEPTPSPTPTASPQASPGSPTATLATPTTTSN
jgi:plastocyanin